MFKLKKIIETILIQPMGFDSIKDYFDAIFGLKYPLFMFIYTSSVFLFFNVYHFIENYIWLDVHAYMLLVIMIFIDFVLHIIRLMNEKIKIKPEDFILPASKIVTYTTLLSLAMNLNAVSQYYNWLPEVLYIMFSGALFVSIFHKFVIMGTVSEKKLEAIKKKMSDLFKTFLEK